MKKRAFLVGGYQTAQSLAESLFKKGYQITIINENYDICLELAELEGVDVIHGDGSRSYVLEDANVEKADIVIALSDRDDDNLVICELCKKKFQVKKTATLVNDPQKVDFFYKMGVDSVVCSITAVTSTIENQTFMDEITSILPIGVGRIIVTKVPIFSSSPAINKKIMDINLPPETIIGCILRGEHNIIPRGDMHIFTDDILIVITSDNYEETAIKTLTGSYNKSN